MIVRSRRSPGCILQRGTRHNATDRVPVDDHNMDMVYLLVAPAVGCSCDDDFATPIELRLHACSLVDRGSVGTSDR
jgi:hypothetical protein